MKTRNTLPLTSGFTQAGVYARMNARTRYRQAAGNETEN
jgi:hypothetical protein